MHTCIISVSTTALNAIATVRKEHAWVDRAVTLDCRYAGNDSLVGDTLAAALNAAQKADLVLLDLMGVDGQVQHTIGKRLSGAAGHIVVTNSDRAGVRELTRLGKFSLSAMRKKAEGKDVPWQEKMARARKMMAVAEKASETLPVGMLRDMRNYFRIASYWRYADEYNMYHLLCLLAGEYGRLPDVPRAKPPKAVEDAVIRDPRSGASFKTRTAWEKKHPGSTDRPIVALLYNSGRYPVDTHPAIGMLLDALECSIHVVPIAINRITTGNIRRLRKLLPPGIDSIVNLLSFRLGQGPMGGNAEEALLLLRELDVPVLHPFFMTRRSETQWLENPHGAQPSEFLISIFLPELDGCIESIPTGAVNPDSGTWGGLDLLSERVDRLISRIHNWHSLRHKKNSDKRLAVILYNYPPGEGGIGAGAFLDVLSSLEAVLRELYDKGYDVSPLTAEELRHRLEDQGRCNIPRWHSASGDITVTPDTYSSMISGAPWAKKIDGYWGPFPGSVMVDDTGVRIPGFIEGNVFVGLQPPRTQGVVSARDYHDPYKPPHHQYTAFYRWLEHGFEADAVIHFGTHGTLEFLPGKETAPSGDCFPDALIGSMPHIYCYYSGNPSESSIAKRRSHAVMISHLQPPFVPGGLYGEMQEIAQLLDEYSSAVVINPIRLDAIADDIMEKSMSLGWDYTEVTDIAERVDELRRSLVPGRMHQFGTPFSHDEAIDFLWQFHRCSHDGDAGFADTVAHEHGVHWNTVKDDAIRFSREIEKVEQECRTRIESIAALGVPPADPLEEKTWHLYHALVKSTELENLCRSLEGKFISAGLGGDVFRNPEVLPTGRNLFQYDPRSIPSPSATRAGIRIAENICTMYKEKHGEYPKSIAVVLWGLETSKTNGESVAQILHLLGVKVLRPNPWETNLEIIPLGKLGRPRVDVTVQMSGFLRDLFPNVIDLIQQALELIGALKESDEQNPVLPHTRAIAQALYKQGIHKEDARELSLARVFGPDAGVYGTAVTGLVKSKEWENEKELVDAYTHSLRFVYTKRFYGREMKNLLSLNLEKVEAVSQIRSSMDYEITDLDHYYEFLGGLSKTVSQTSGKNAMVLVSDSVEGAARTETARHSIQRGIRSRLLNPRWQDGMLAHDYHGAQEFASRLENLVGLAATTGEVDNAIFEDTAKALVLDDAMRERLTGNNPYALREIMNRLFEAEARGYWNTSAETLETMQQLYLTLEGEIEAQCEHSDRKAVV